MESKKTQPSPKLSPTQTHKKADTTESATVEAAKLGIPLALYKRLRTADHVVRGEFAIIEGRLPPSQSQGPAKEESY